MRIGWGNNKERRSDFSEEEKRFMQRYTYAECNRLSKMIKNMKPSKEPQRLRVLRSKLPLSVKTDIFTKLAENESNKYAEWVENVLKLPIGTYTKPPSIEPAVMLKNALKTMNEEITGHDEVKNEVLRMICGWITNGGKNGFAIGLEGEPGVGKTTFVKQALSKCMDRPFCFISLGGASDSAGLLGHSYTYEGAIYGRLADALITSGCMDPIIFFDELDKVSPSNKGEELIHSLLHLTDPVQNDHIRDRYFHGINLDLSRATLVFSYNDASRVNPILLDRIKKIVLRSPTQLERMKICQEHLVPRAIERANLAVNVPEDVVEYIVRRNEQTGGMRSIEKDIAHVVSSYSLIHFYGTPSVLDLDHSVLDRKFARSVLSRLDVERPDAMSRSLMYC